jgi:hypothetical protein
MKRYLSTVLLLLLVLPVLAQSGGIAPNQGLNNQWVMNDVKNNQLMEGDRPVAGSPYLNKNFKPGELIGKNNKKIFSAPLRYNIYTDNIEYKSPKNKIYTLIHPNQDQVYKIGDTLFVYTPFYRSGDKLSDSYFQLMVNGKKVRGLVRFSIYIQPFEQAKPFTPEQPPRFSGVNTSYYVQIGNAPARVVTNNKSFLKLFPDNKNKISQFIKKEHIHIQKQADFAKLIQYCNTL